MFGKPKEFLPLTVFTTSNLTDFTFFLSLFCKEKTLYRSCAGSHDLIYIFNLGEPMRHIWFLLVKIQSMYVFRIGKQRSRIWITKGQCPNVSTTPIMAMGCRQCLPLSVVQLKGKHCRKPHCRNRVVDTYRL